MPTAFMSMLPRPCATGLLRPKRLFEVDGTTGGAPSSHCGLEARGGHGLRPATQVGLARLGRPRKPNSATAEFGGGGGGKPTHRAWDCPLHHASHGPPPPLRG